LPEAAAALGLRTSDEKPIQAKSASRWSSAESAADIDPEPVPAILPQKNMA